MGCSEGLERLIIYYHQCTAGACLSLPSIMLGFAARVAASLLFVMYHIRQGLSISVRWNGAWVGLLQKAVRGRKELQKFRLHIFDLH